MGKETAAGGTATSFTGAEPKVLVAGVLPDEVSRHNSPARADAIRHVVSNSGATKAKGKTGIVLVLDDAEHAVAAVNAVGRALPSYTSKTSGTKGRVQIWLVDTEGNKIAAPAVANAVLQSARDAAEQVDTPPTELNPEAFAARAKALLAPLKVKVEEIVGDDLIKAGLNGIHGVGRCALNAPRMLVATHDPKNGSGHHVALVGKGVTFDTGGLNLKTGNFMIGMKCDMGGAAAVLGAFRVLVQTGCKHRLSLVLCLAENAIGAASFKPDDILTMHSGKTVEINNTDAEGRLLLADGVSYAARELGADTIFDAATLTGAQLVSTGLRHAAVVSNDEPLEQLMLEAGRDSGDLCHALIFAPEFFMEEFESPVADMRNSVANRMNAQSSCAAQFVYSHIQDAPKAATRRWCHVDMAGPASLKDRGTGFGVALLAEAVRRLPA